VGEFEQRGGNDSDVFELVVEKIAQADKRANHFDVDGCFSVFDGLQFVFPCLQE